MKSYILVVEDSDEDFLILQRAFSKCCISLPVVRFSDGMGAAEYLLSAEEQQMDRYPCLILLDLNLPYMDGRSFLDWIKNKPVLKRIPVVVLTTSGNREDINECYRRGANSYLRKPQQFDDFLNVVQLIKQYWLEVSVMPFKMEPIA
ncbi:response regulator [Cesiribacter sp. SM1]|uniref:response regulator n=1 Tax=Cesiribacter sp. SM1 TaxID=2861196 RepID=UPI001CD774CF|nr:response regulator [Cesiribacter sp. SM1]